MFLEDQDREMATAPGDDEMDTNSKDSNDDEDDDDEESA